MLLLLKTQTRALMLLLALLIKFLKVSSPYFGSKDLVTKNFHMDIGAQKALDFY